GTLQMQGEIVWLASEPTVVSRDSGHLAAIAEVYETAGLAAPLVREVGQQFRLSETEMRRLVTLLQRQKILVRMGSDDLFMHARALDHLATRMAVLRGSLIDVGRFKQLTGLSRKYAIPL